MTANSSAVRPKAPLRRVGHYELLDVLGRGGMGVVYRARDLLLDRLVALKCPLVREPIDPELRERLFREGRAAARLWHPHIVPVFEVFEEDGVPWLAMQLVSGETLRGVIQAQGALAPARALRYARELAAALDAAHRAGVLHRDIKPGNVMIADDGRAMLGDFGLAGRALGSNPESLPTMSGAMTGTGILLGTLGYVSPEQLHGHPADEKTDIFALGAVIYEMFTGMPAFPAGTLAEALASVLERAPAPLASRVAGLPPELEHAVRRAIARDPAERYVAAAELGAALQAIELGSEMRATAPRARLLRGALLRLAGNRRRRRRLGVAVAGLGGLGLALVIARGRPEASAPAPVRAAVLAPLDLTHGTQAAGVTGLVQSLLVDELSGASDLVVVDPESLNADIERALGSAAPRHDRRLYEFLRDDGVSLAIDTTLTVVPEGLRLQLSLVRPRDGAVTFSHATILAGATDVKSAVRAEARAVLSFLQVRALVAPMGDDLTPWITPQRHDIEAVKSFLQAARYIYRYEPGGRQHLEEAIAIEPTFVAPRVWLVSMMSGAGRFEMARDQLKVLRELKPHASPFEQAMIDWSSAAVAQDLAGQARHLEIALGFSPGNHILLVNLGEIRYRTGDAERGMEALLQCARARWPYPEVYTLLAKCQILLGSAKEARRTLVDSIEIAPPLPETYALLAALAARDGDEAATIRFDRLYEARRREAGMSGELPADLARVVRVLAAAASGNDSGVSEALRLRAIRLGTDSATRLTALAEEQLGASNLEEAERLCARAQAIDPGFSRSALVLGRVSEARGDLANAALHYRSYLDGGGSERQETEAVRRRLGAFERTGK